MVSRDNPETIDGCGAASLVRRHTIDLGGIRRRQYVLFVRLSSRQARWPPLECATTGNTRTEPGMKTLRRVLIALVAPASLLLGVTQLGGNPISKGYSTGFASNLEAIPTARLTLSTDAGDLTCW